MFSNRLDISFSARRSAEIITSSFSFTSAKTDMDFSIIEAKNLETVKIWKEEKGKVEIIGQELYLKDLTYGIFIKGAR